MFSSSCSSPRIIDPLTKGLLLLRASPDRFHIDRTTTLEMPLDPPPKHKRLYQYLLSKFFTRCHAIIIQAIGDHQLVPIFSSRGPPKGYQTTVVVLHKRSSTRDMPFRIAIASSPFLIGVCKILIGMQERLHSATLFHQRVSPPVLSKLR